MWANTNYKICTEYSNTYESQMKIEMFASNYTNLTIYSFILNSEYHEIFRRKI